MGFYDRDKALRGMGQARENMSNIIAQSANASAQANDNIAKAIGTISDGITKSVAGYLKNEADLKNELERKNALVSALEKGGASKEIVEAAKSAKKSDDILPLVGVIANPKNIVEMDHSYGQVKTKNVFTGKEDNFGTSYAGVGSKGGGGSGDYTYFPLNDPRITILNNNAEARNSGINAGVLKYDQNGNPKTNNPSVLDEIIASAIYNKTAKLPSEYKQKQQKNKEDYPLIFGGKEDMDKFFGKKK